MTHPEIVEKLKNQFGQDILEAYENYDMLNIHVPADKIYSFLEYLKTDAELNFHFLTDLTAVHNPFDEGAEFLMVYHLHNMPKNIRIRIKASIPASNPSIDSIHQLWPSANWQERETFDFFGVNFIGHPNLIRIMNVDEMDYFPLQKQYPLEDTTRQDKNDAMFGR
jgi:NADH-quinone oxidoreductase subunit C